MGGNGGNGAGGGASYAAGGGGGSGAQTIVLVPAYAIPDTLVVSVAIAASILIAFEPTLNVQSLLVRANTGSNGGNATTTTVGSAGSGGTVATIAQMPRAAVGYYSVLAGQNGTTNVANVAFPTTGLCATGGAVGGAAGAAGGNGIAGKTVGYTSTLALGTTYTNQGGIPGNNGFSGGPGQNGVAFGPCNSFAGGSGGGGSGGSGTVSGGAGGSCTVAYG